MKRHEAREGRPRIPLLFVQESSRAVIRSINPLPRNAPDLEQAKSEPPHVERDEGRRFSSRTTRIRGSSSMTSCSMILVALFAQVWLEKSTADNGAHAYFRSRSRQNPRPAADGLGKTIWERFILAISPRKSGNLAKTGDSRAAWGNSKRNLFIMAITLFSDGYRAKTGDRVWGNSKWNPFIMAIPPEKAALTPKPAPFDSRGEIRIGNGLSWRSRTNRDRIGGTIPIGDIIQIGEIVGIGEGIWTSETRRDGLLSSERSTTGRPNF